MGIQWFRTERKVAVQVATVSNDATPDGIPIDYRGYIAGSVFYGSGIQAATITWYGARALLDEGGTAITPVALYDSAGAAVTQAIGAGAKAYPIPDACAGVPYLYLKTSVAGDDNESVYVTVKS